MSLTAPAVSVYSFSPVVPAGTVQGSPATTALVLPQLVVARIEIKIPPGPAGNLGFYIGCSGQQVIPYQSGQWIVGDDDDLDFYLSDQPTTGVWDFVGYNTGIYDHGVEMRFHLSNLPVGTSAPAQPPIQPNILSGG